jgi:hypothetical protein
MNDRSSTLDPREADTLRPEASEQDLILADALDTVADRLDHISDVQANGDKTIIDRLNALELAQKETDKTLAAGFSSIESTLGSILKMLKVDAKEEAQSHADTPAK